jgi:hypothetical protein
MKIGLRLIVNAVIRNGIRINVQLSSMKLNNLTSNFNWNKVIKKI